MNKKVYEDVLSGKADYNIKYSDFKNLIEALGFELERQRGSLQCILIKTSRNT